MKLRVQVVIEADDDEEDGDHPPAVHEVAQIDREALSVDTLGLHLEEAKNLLQKVQAVLIDEQVRTSLAQQVACPNCGRPRAHKDTRTIVTRTLFGTLHLRSPRWRQCPCQPQTTRTFSPLAAALPERTTPELLYLESKFAGLVSYGLSARLLAETLPIGRPLYASAVRLHTQATGERLESELGPEQSMFADGCQLDWDELPRPDLPLTVGLDGGYVHSSQQRSRRDGWFEVIAGKSMPTDGPAKCFGFVQTYDTKPKRRLFEVLKSQGMQMNQQVTFLTDGGEDVRDLPLYLNPQAEHLIDWFHITMRLTVMSQMTKGLRSRDNPELAAEVAGGVGTAEVVPVARQRLPRAANGRRSADRPRQHRAAEPRAAEAAQDGHRVRRLHSSQRRVDPKLWRAVSIRRGHLQRVRRVDGQPGGQQAHGQEAADALGTQERSPAAPGPRQSAERRTR